jgi:FMN phosphatase YigB (HAD superfamily)
MKALIFDIDNTLIMWKDEFIFALTNVVNKMNFGFNKEMIHKIDSAIEDYDDKTDLLTKEGLLNHVNKLCNLDLPIEFVDNLIIEQGNCIYEDQELIDTIEYLSKKYDLFIVSNWFTDTQTSRLERMGIKKYFKNIWCSDNNYEKPDKRSFDCILKDYKNTDCISIGDNLTNDVLLPLSLGMDAIWVTNKETNEYKTVKNVYELKNIL